MNWVDFVIIGIIAVSALISLVRGLIPELLSLLTWVAAFVLAMQFFTDAAPYFAPYLEKEMLQQVAGFGAVFLGTLIAGALLSYIVGVLVKATGLKPMDRFLGVFFGAARGGVIVTLLVLGMGLASVPQREPDWKESQLMPHFELAASWVRERLPENVQEHFEFNSDPEQQPETSPPGSQLPGSDAAAAASSALGSS